MKMLHFKDSEFACKHCGKLPANGMNPVLLAKLDHLRTLVEAPIIVTSGYRCPVHNRNEGGVSNSQHVLGNAADIVCRYTSVSKLAEKARQLGFDGIGVYPKSNFVHVDCRSNGEEPCEYNWTE